MQRHIWIPLLAAALVGTAQLQALDNDKKQEKEPAAALGAPADSITEGTVTVGGLAIAYLVLACLFFASIYRYAIRTGLIARYSAETVS